MSDDISTIVRIDDEQIDAPAVYARIREGLQRHGPPAAIDFPRFERPRAPELSGDLFSGELARDLEKLNASFDQVWVELSFVEQHLPIVGGFVNRYKRDLHQLVVYYVNMLAQRQQSVNADLVQVINRIVADIDAAGVASLQREVDDLRARLTALEGRAGPAG